MIYTIGCSLGNRSTVEDCLNYFRDHEEIQVDTETTGLDPHKDKIISLQIGDTDNQYFIDTRKIDIRRFESLLLEKRCILHNAKFDYKMLKAAGIVLNRIYDTMLAECVLFCGYENWGYGLDKLVQRYLSIDISKDERQTFVGMHKDAEFTEKQIEYGCRDVMHLQRIKDRQVNRIRSVDLDYCVDLENEVVKALADIEYNGMILDKTAWNSLTEQHKIKLESIHKQLDRVVFSDPLLTKWKPSHIQGNLFGHEVRPVKINYGSPKQVLEICQALGFKIESTNDAEISKFAKLDDSGNVAWAKHPFMGLLLQSRQVAKIVSTYGDSFLDYINPATGRVHTDFWQVLNTGRVSSGGKKVNAPNLQNLPAKNTFRNCFKARPGYKWVSIDYSGQELRLMADASGEEGFISVLNRGDDLHCYAGEMMFKRPIDKKKDKELRNQAKTINFGKPYGMGVAKLANTLSITEAEAEELFTIYAKAFPALNKWLEDQGRFAVVNGLSRTFAPCKRIRWYPEINKAKELRKKVQKGDKATWREIMITEGQVHRNGMNSPIQGTGADITKEALVEVRKLIISYNDRYKEEVAFLICTVHDAIDVEVREDLSQQFAEEMARIMIACGNKYVSKVNMEVDVTITNEWTK